MATRRQREIEPDSMDDPKLEARRDRKNPLRRANLDSLSPEQRTALSLSLGLPLSNRQEQTKS